MESGEVIEATEGIKTAYEKYAKFYEEFEEKYPLLATGTEVVVHAIIGPVFEGMHVGKEALHAIELLAALGGAEKLTAHLVNVGNTIKESLNKAKEKLLKFKLKAEPEELAMAA